LIEQGAPENHFWMGSSENAGSEKVKSCNKWKISFGSTVT